MYKIKTMNHISPYGLQKLEERGCVVGEDIQAPDGLILRSADLHSYAFEPSLIAIARSGAGTNNIPLEDCCRRGIVVFNSPGANAEAVKEQILCSLVLSSRDVLGSIDWVKGLNGRGKDIPALVEKGKSQFAGPELMGKTLGVIGLGAIGSLVANIALSLGMDVYGYDPFLSVDAALSLSRFVHRAMDLETIYKNCDYITLHVPQTPETRGMINTDAINMMKGHVRILNLARGGLVNDDYMRSALETGRGAAYVTDFPNNKIVQGKRVVAIPHLGASSPESEENCAVMAAQELKDYLENGNIRNAVNLPSLVQDWSGETRLCIIHRNVPNMLASVTTVLSREHVNVENMTNKSRGEYAYTIVDVSARVGDAVADELRAIDGILRVRVLNH